MPRFRHKALHRIDVLVDRLALHTGPEERLRASLEKALASPEASCWCPWRGVACGC